MYMFVHLIHILKCSFVRQFLYTDNPGASYFGLVWVPRVGVFKTGGRHGSFCPLLHILYKPRELQVPSQGMFESS